MIVGTYDGALRKEPMWTGRTNAGIRSPRSRDFHERVRLRVPRTIWIANCVFHPANTYLQGLNQIKPGDSTSHRLGSEVPAGARRSQPFELLRGGDLADAMRTNPRVKVFSVERAV